MRGRAIRQQRPDWKFAQAIVEPALAAFPATYLSDLRANLANVGIQKAVAQHDTAAIFDWMIPLIQLQGISDSVAFAYLEANGGVTWGEVEATLRDPPSCPKLRSHWHFEGCGFRKSTSTCAEPFHLHECPLPRHALRKGVLNQAAYALYLFMRDVCDGDLIGWIDDTLLKADLGQGAPDRTARMRAALLDPLRNVVGISDKLWSMILAELLLGGDPQRERWVATGATFIAIDSLVHAFLHRTGVLRRFNAEHAYGDRCYAPGGCSEVIEGLAARIDAREFSPDNPACFPRLIQSAIWRFCSQDYLNVCNGNMIDDRARCANWCCPAFERCDRLPSSVSSIL